ncbi:MAG: hypothetical protein ACOCYE_09430 [Pseudomonadota bacterium]
MHSDCLGYTSLDAIDDDRLRALLAESDVVAVTQPGDRLADQAGADLAAQAIATARTGADAEGALRRALREACGGAVRFRQRREEVDGVMATLLEFVADDERHAATVAFAESGAPITEAIDDRVILTRLLD